VPLNPSTPQPLNPKPIDRKRQDAECAEREAMAVYTRLEGDKVRFAKVRSMSQTKDHRNGPAPGGGAATSSRATERALEEVMRPKSAPGKKGRTEYAHNWLERTDEKVSGTSRSLNPKP
jgi:hypothetical protein